MTVPRKLIQSYGKAAVQIYQSCITRHSVPAPDQKAQQYLRLSAVQAAKKIREGEISSTDLVSAYLDRIHLVNPYINAAVQIFEHDAMEGAKKVDAYLQNLDKSSEEFKNLVIKKPFLGVPMSVKNSFYMKGKRVYAGLVHRRNCPVADENAEAVQLLMDAGAIPTCYTNTPASCIWLESSNKIFGRTSTAYDTRTTSGGSSGGEGAIIGAEGAVMGIGSDIAGSIRVPSTFNGIFGLKPRNTMPMIGHFPDMLYPDGSVPNYVKEMATCGPMARYAEDCTMMYHVLSKRPIPKDFSSLKPRQLFCTTLESPVISEISPDMDAAYRKSLSFLQKEFGMKANSYQPPDHERMITLYQSEVAPPTGPPVTTLLFKEDPEKQPPINHYKEVIRAALGISELDLSSTTLIGFFGTSVTPEKYAKYREEVTALRKQLHELIKDSIIVAPTMPQSHYFHGEQIAAVTDYWYAAMWNLLSCPAIVCPVGLSKDGYPVSVQLISSPENEYLLLSAAERISREFGGWQPARYTETN